MLGNEQNLGPKIDVRSYPTVKCDKCGCEIFESKYIFKEISGLELGYGTENIAYPINVFVCSKCGTIMKSDREQLEKTTDMPEEIKPKSSLIL